MHEEYLALVTAMKSLTQERAVTTPALDVKTPRKVAFFSYVIL